MLTDDGDFWSVVHFKC